MSFAGQVDCQRIVVGPVACWPLPIIGNARADAPAAPARNLRRVEFGVAAAATGMPSFIVSPLGWSAIETLVGGLEIGDRLCDESYSPPPERAIVRVGIRAMAGPISYSICV